MGNGRKDDWLIFPVQLARFDKAQVKQGDYWPKILLFDISIKSKECFEITMNQFLLKKSQLSSSVDMFIIHSWAQQ